MAKNVEGSTLQGNSQSSSSSASQQNGLENSQRGATASGQTPQPSTAVTTTPLISLEEAVQEVLRHALATPVGVAKGLHEAAKALDRRQALLCILALNCDEAMYIKLVEALCNSHLIPLVKVEDKKKLGEWVGLCKMDREGRARKVVPCSCAVVKDFGVNSPGLEYLKANIVI